MNGIPYARSYLSLARVGIEELKNQNYISSISDFERLSSYEEKLLSL